MPDAPQPDPTPRAADRVLLPLASAAAAGFCAAVWADPQVLPRTPTYFGLGLVGLFAARLWHPYRGLGLVPLGATAAAGIGLAGSLGGWAGWMAAVFPLAVGLGVGAVLRHRDRDRTDARRFAASGVGVAVVVVGLAGLFVAAPRPGLFSWVATVAAAVAAGLGWVTLFRPTFEWAFCLAVRFLYRIRATGPGLTAFPPGPVLVIANHGDWFDPALVGGSLPRPVVALMTAAFYDKPGLSWLMRVFGTIRVPETAVKRTAPEIDLAVQALDAGRVVLLFPEGYLRRSEEVPLRRFGQGVWKLLCQRPGTVVVPCWVEGTWGSYFSHQGGPPTTGKRFRPFRPVTVCVGEPFTVSPAVLADRMGTRLSLMRKVADARPLGGFPPLDLGKPPEADDT
jgi:1-acyl-sn-glycerol-3-phosphate acyltransferase